MPATTESPAITLTLTSVQSLTLISAVTDIIEYADPSQVEILNDILIKLSGSDHPQIVEIRQYALLESPDLVY